MDGDYGNPFGSCRPSSDVASNYGMPYTAEKNKKEKKKKLHRIFLFAKGL